MFVPAAMIISQHVEDVHRHVRMQAFAGDAGEFAELGNESQHILSLRCKVESRFRCPGTRPDSSSTKHCVWHVIWYL